MNIIQRSIAGAFFVLIASPVLQAQAKGNPALDKGVDDSDLALMASPEDGMYGDQSSVDAISSAGK